MPGWGAGPSASQQGAGGGPTYKINDVQRQVDDVKAVMQENVEVMLQNIDKTEARAPAPPTPPCRAVRAQRAIRATSQVLEAKSADLAANAKTFHKSSREVKRTMCKQNAKMNIIIGIICCVIILAIIIPIAVTASQAAAAADNNKDRRRLSLLFGGARRPRASSGAAAP